MKIITADRLMAQPRERWFVFCALVMVVALLLILQTNQYYSREAFGDVKVLWVPNEAYVFLQKDTQFSKVKRWEALLARHFGLWRGPTNQFTRNDTTVFYLRNSSLSEYKQENFDIRGRIFSSEDVPWILKGGNQISGYKWAQDHFEKIVADELPRVQSLLASDHADTTGTNWHKLDWEEMGTIGENYDRTFEFREKEFKTILHIKTGTTSLDKEGYVAHNPDARITLSINGELRTLLELSPDYKPITAREYETNSIGQP